CVRLFMSYRAFKRLLGETSLERKCRFLFGGFILLLITGSFWLYARQTEHLAYDQLTTACRLLVVQVVDQQLATGCRPVTRGAPELARPNAIEQKRMEQALSEFRRGWEEHWPEKLREYKFTLIKPSATRLDQTDQTSLQYLKAFREDRTLQEESVLLLPQD